MIEPLRPTSKVTLEDLIRIKRAERPPAEFWVEFERSLRAKQLAAIVEKKPWWRSLGTLPRWSTPLAAAAALTITFVTVNRSQPSSAKPLDVAKSEQQPQVAVAETSHESMVVASLSQAPAAEVKVAPAPVAAEPKMSKAAELAQATAAAPSPVAAHAGTQVASVTEQIAGIATESRTEQPAAAQFASVTHSESPSIASLGSYFDRAVAHFGDSLRDDKSVVEPLSQVPSPRDARRARLLAYSTSLDNRSPQYSESTNVVRSRERITSHLNEEALYDSLHRLGLKANRVSIQF